jgi:hypothetical protein
MLHIRKFPFTLAMLIAFAKHEAINFSQLSGMMRTGSSKAKAAGPMAAGGSRPLPSRAPKRDQTRKKGAIFWAFVGVSGLSRPAVVAPLHFRMVALGERALFMHASCCREQLREPRKSPRLFPRTT